MKKLFVSMWCLLFMLFMLLLSGCDREIVIVGHEIGQPPDRIIYIANVDTELDLTGATLVSIARDGYRHPERLLTTLLQQYQYPNSSTEVRHSIDFTTPGVYEVVIVRVRNGRHYLPFFIQVIDEETFNQLKSGEFGTEED